MIEPFWGEFLVSPVPLELSFDVCSHACLYCFSRLNQPKRRVDLQALMRQLAEYPERRGYSARLLQAGYPVCVSNRTDAFSKNNYRKALPILRVMTDLGIPIQFQTKGGYGIEEALEFLQPAVWYVSISTMDDDLSKRVEPGAPPPSERLALMRRLRDAGHYVILGFNPCVYEWQPDPEPLLRAAKDAGALGAWVELLHFNRRQAARLSKRARAVLGEEVIRRAKRRKPDETDWRAFHNARDVAQALGLEVYSMGQPNNSGFWDVFRHVYPVTFPTLQDLINYCHDTRTNVVRFREFLDLVGDQLPDGVLPIDSYLGATAHQLWRTGHVPAQMSFSRLLEMVWGDPRIKQCPARTWAFAYLGEDRPGGDGWVQYVDEDQMPLLVFDDNGEQRLWYTAEVG